MLLRVMNQRPGPRLPHWPHHHHHTTTRKSTTTSHQQRPMTGKDKNKALQMSTQTDSSDASLPNGEAQGTPAPPPSREGKSSTNQQDQAAAGTESLWTSMAGTGIARLPLTEAASAINAYYAHTE
ncbi:hypothetical protein Pcinc_028831 [Petrolisthes cinctipes]|uniref:Uncharacterized protein n=1 Tax=Petrolisthes cinctipes TaxID=88211 RepID=A0AAE1F240_PETCI|nr:hypothetical protein Pcinc_028831 [Petrolisthes cinctipes]